MPRSLGRTGSVWRTVRAQVLREEDTCCLCPLPVDKTLSGRHPWGPTIQHVPPLKTLEAQGLDPRDRRYLHLAHRTCNLRAGTRGTIRSRRRTPRRSRAW